MKAWLGSLSQINWAIFPKAASSIAGRASLAWEHDNVRLRWTATYLGDVLESRFRQEQYGQLLLTNPSAEYPMFLDIEGVFEHDFYASYEFELSGRELRLSGGVNNMFDETSPFLPYRRRLQRSAHELQQCLQCRQ